MAGWDAPTLEDAILNYLEILPNVLLCVDEVGPSVRAGGPLFSYRLCWLRGLFHIGRWLVHLGPL